MARQNNLAIVIPAYKSTFLAAALDSIAAQTCKDFTLYIGDDCSPNNLGEIVDRYRDKINLVYKRFDNNLGGKDLVAQWERCIDMTQGEEWIWLFSDDDLMEARCVEEFYKTIKDKPQAGLIHFNVSCLDDATGKVSLLPVFPKFCSSKFYLDEKIRGHLISFVVEFVVRRNIFFDNGRFQNFDLAWGSDFISWVKFWMGKSFVNTRYRISNWHTQYFHHHSYVYYKIFGTRMSVPAVNQFGFISPMGHAWGGGKDRVRNASIHINHYYTKAWNVYREKMQRPDVYFTKNAKDAQKLITREMKCTEKNYTILRFLQKMRYDNGEITL